VVLSLTCGGTGVGSRPTSAPSRGGGDKYDCVDFATQQQAQTRMDATGDVDHLDVDGDGEACETVFGERYGGSAQRTPRSSGDVLDCADFSSQAEAQYAMDAYANEDRLDVDGDGEACETRFGERPGPP
jgi:hypothetical protein